MSEHHESSLVCSTLPITAPSSVGSSHKSSSATPKPNLAFESSRQPLQDLAGSPNPLSIRDHPSLNLKPDQHSDPHSLSAHHCLQRRPRLFDISPIGSNSSSSIGDQVSNSGDEFCPSGEELGSDHSPRISHSSEEVESPDITMNTHPDGSSLIQIHHAHPRSEHWPPPRAGALRHSPSPASDGDVGQSAAHYESPILAFLQHTGRPHDLLPSHTPSPPVSTPFLGRLPAIAATLAPDEFKTPTFRSPQGVGSPCNLQAAGTSHPPHPAPPSSSSGLDIARLSVHFATPTSSPMSQLATGRTTSTASFSTTTSSGMSAYSDLSLDQNSISQSEQDDLRSGCTDEDLLLTPLTPPSVLFPLAGLTVKPPPPPPKAVEPDSSQVTPSAAKKASGASEPNASLPPPPPPPISSLSYLPSVNNNSKHRVPFTDFLAEQFLKIQSLSPITTSVSDSNPAELVDQYNGIRLELNEYILKNSSLSNATNPNRDGRGTSDCLQQNEIIILNGLIQLLDDKLVNLACQGSQYHGYNQAHSAASLVPINSAIIYDVGGGRNVDERAEAEEVEGHARSKIIINNKELTAEEELKLLKAQVRDFARVCKVGHGFTPLSSLDHVADLEMIISFA